jgi:hypothetical protein
MAPRSSNGRLSRVGLFTEPRRQKLARPRPRDVYEFPDESPEKGPFNLPQSVNRSAPTKIIERKKAQKEDDVPSPEAVQPSSEGNVVEEAGSEDSEIERPMPSSPPKVVQAPNDVEESDVQIERRLRNGNTRCAVTSYRSDKPAGPRYEQCHNVGAHDTEEGPRCTRHVDNPGSLRCEYMSVQDGDPVQCRVAGVKGTALCSKHAKLPTNNESKRKRKSVDEIEAQGEPSRSIKVPKSKSNHEVQMLVRESGKDRPAKQKPGSKQLQPSYEEVAESIEDVGSAASSNTRRKSTEVGNKSTQLALALRKTTKKGSESAAKEDQPQSADAEGDNDDNVQEDPNDEGASGTMTYMPRAVRRAFKFLDLEKRSGRCKTELCLSIKSVCDKVSALLQDNSLSVEEIAENIDDVQGVLNEVRNTDQGDRVAIKADMYGYVFRSLTKVLRSLYRALAEHEDDVTQSLDAMRIFSPLVHHILLIKDLLASWKVTVPQLYEGDRLIKDVDIHLIAPLRLVDDNFGKCLRHLESKEKAKQELADVERRIEEENEETERANTRKASQRDRWKRWQDLHILRMACEPDPHKRVPLRIIKLDEFEETDANGVKFQRLPVFKDRETPPAHNPQAAVKLKSWSDEQQQVLLEALPDLAGTLKTASEYRHVLTEHAGPDVFEKIFNRHCRPRNGGLLRDFRVMDIVTKVAWIRTNMIKLHQEKGSELPDWVTRIPVLP